MDSVPGSPLERLRGDPRAVGNVIWLFATLIITAEAVAISVLTSQMGTTGWVLVWTSWVILVSLVYVVCRGLRGSSV